MAVIIQCDSAHMTICTLQELLILLRDQSEY